MTDRYDVCVPVKYQKGGEERTAFRKVGAAFPNKKGDGFNLRLDYPVAVTELCLFTPKPRDNEPNF